jgi:hypothetical protein
MTISNDILTISEAADFTGISQSLLRYHALKRHLPLNALNQTMIFSKSALSDFMAKRADGAFQKTGRPVGAKDSKPRVRRKREMAT